jgi:hypothetical protein
MACHDDLNKHVPDDVLKCWRTNLNHKEPKNIWDVFVRQIGYYTPTEDRKFSFSVCLERYPSKLSMTPIHSIFAKYNSVESFPNDFTQMNKCCGKFDITEEVGGFQVDNDTATHYITKQFTENLKKNGFNTSYVEIGKFGVCYTLDATKALAMLGLRSNAEKNRQLSRSAGSYLGLSSYQSEFYKSRTAKSDAFLCLENISNIHKQLTDLKCNISKDEVKTEAVRLRSGFPNIVLNELLNPILIQRITAEKK